MHAGFPCFTANIHQVMRLGATQGNIPLPLEAVGGHILAGGIALLLKIGFGYLMRDSLLDKHRALAAEKFFNENFVFIDPASPTGKNYYQGKFLVRTGKPGDEMNVYFRFCPNPDELFIETPLGQCLNSLAVINTEVLTEAQADRIESNPDKVDLVIRFRDISSILSLIGRDELDIVGLLLENVVQLTGNVGHLFKLGAIASEIEQEIGL